MNSFFVLLSPHRLFLIFVHLVGNFPGPLFPPRKQEYVYYNSVDGKYKYSYKHILDIRLKHLLLSKENAFSYHTQFKKQET